MKQLFAFLAAILLTCSLNAAPASGGRIVIDKQAMTLTVEKADGSVKACFPIACGKAYGNKQRPGDNRTPEGTFSISQIQNASTWTHDFKDGKGVIKGAYGPWFLRLDTPPHRGIGIHGTHAPNSIGTRATEGCIRLNNAHVDSLKRMVQVGMPVIIKPSEQDTRVNNAR